MRANQNKSKGLLLAPSNAVLQLIGVANKAAMDGTNLGRRLSDEIEPAALAKNINYSTASRSELEQYRRALKIAEDNATEAPPQYLTILKDEREKVEASAKTFQVDDQTVRGLLKGIDERHARTAAFVSQMMPARAQFYHATGGALDILIEQFGSYKVKPDGQFVFSSQPAANRYNAAANETRAATKHLVEMEEEGKRLAQTQREAWGRWVDGK
jgi:hypothetical protein